MEDSVVIEAMEHMAAHAKVHTPEKTARKVSILNEILECSPTAQVDIWKNPRLHSQLSTFLGNVPSTGLMIDVYFKPSYMCRIKDKGISGKLNKYMYISNKVLYIIIQASLPAVAALKVLMDACAYAMPILRFCYSQLTLFLSLRLRSEKLGSLSIDDGNGSENFSFKMNSRFFNLSRVYIPIC